MTKTVGALLVSLGLVVSHGTPNDACVTSADVRACYVAGQQVTLSRWHGEMTLRLSGEGDYRPLPDGFEVSRTLLLRPTTNVFHWTLRTSATAAYQPALASQHPDGSTWQQRQVRPAAVNGSYAFYHPSRRGDWRGLGGENYRAGKFVHLYRPWAQDARGRRVWADLCLDGSDLSITVPWGFLETAQYPVIVDPTFGYTTNGASTDGNGFDLQYFYAGTTPASSGTVTSITGYVGTPGSSASDFDVAIYSNVVGVATLKLADGGTGTNIGAATALAQVSSTISYAITSGTQYWLGIRGSSGTLTWGFDAKGYNANKGFQYEGPGVAFPVTAANNGQFDEDMTIYATYTASGGGCAAASRLPLLGVGNCQG